MAIYFHITPHAIKIKGLQILINSTVPSHYKNPQTSKVTTILQRDRITGPIRPFFKISEVILSISLISYVT